MEKMKNQIMFALKENIYFLVNDRFLGDCCSSFFSFSLSWGFHEVSMTPIGLFFIFILFLDTYAQQPQRLTEHV